MSRAARPGGASAPAPSAGDPVADRAPRGAGRAGGRRPAGPLRAWRVGLAGFARGEGAALSVEAVLIFPLLLWMTAAIYIFWDGFRAVTVSLKATYTVSDLVSRNPVGLDQDYVDGLQEMLDFLAGGARAGGPTRDGPTALRVSRVRLAILDQTPVDGGPDEYVTELRLERSGHSEGVDPLSDISEIEGHIPMMAPGDQVFVVETFVPWSPLSDVGIPARTIEHVAVTRPRFVSEVCWEACPGG